jgi:diguanylate cyclase (GGDEF)-like protein
VLEKHMALNDVAPCEVSLVRSDGAQIQAEILTRTMSPDAAVDGSGPTSTAAAGARVLAVRDIRERKRTEEHIRFIALHDGLTGLANRRLFVERLHQDLARSKRDGTTVAVLCLDLDRFKLVNDSGGHGAGDELLIQVARRLSESLRGEDTVARLSGDEFAVIQVGVKHPQGPAILAQRLVLEIGKPYEIGGQQIMTGTSIGIALYPGNGTEGDELMRAADTALYRAKEAGRGTFRFFEPEMDLRLQERRALERDLRLALDRGEIRVNYQPLVDCRSGTVLGFEALARWTHPTRGEVPPIEFIPLAEESGLIMRLGAWVMRRACTDAAGWPTDKLVAVNLSSAQFRNAELAQDILTTLRETGLPPTRLEIEITESLLIDDPARVMRTLGALKEAGVRISLDDFGTGYSSLSYLQRFPFDKIKIDRSFVSQMEANPDSMSIVRAVIALGKSLRIEITAEGVETPAQLGLLQQENCDLVQGYLLGRPMANESLGALLAPNAVAAPLPKQAA